MGRGRQVSQVWASRARTVAQSLGEERGFGSDVSELLPFPRSVPFPVPILWRAWSLEHSWPLSSMSLPKSLKFWQPVLFSRFGYPV